MQITLVRNTPTVFDRVPVRVSDFFLDGYSFRLSESVMYRILRSDLMLKLLIVTIKPIFLK